MQIEINRSTLNLAHEGLLAIRDGKGTRVDCHKGTLWITQEGEVKDSVISAGESLTIRHQGLTVVTAIGPSQLAIVHPAPNSLPGKAASSQTASAPASCA